MLSRAFTRYINNFKGFSREIWILTIVTFINRAGTMVLPFLSKYLKEDLDFTYDQVKWVLICFGAGSMIGSWLGGKLSDKMGFYRIMIFSLFTSGIAFIALQYITSFVGLCIGMFAIMVIADMFRPAMFVSLSVYAKPENRTRALTLVRLAINLGFAAGPAIGGLIIISGGYSGLFWVDGLTCILAITLFGLLVKEKKKEAVPVEAIEAQPNKSVFTDAPFWIFLFICMITGVLFFQLFTTLPLYHKEQFNLTEFQSGLLLMLNGLIIFFSEMAVVSYVERKQIDKVKVVTYGLLAMTISMYLLLLNDWAGVLVIMMLFMSFGEMFAFPFSNSFAMSRAPKGHEGRYMAIFTMAYSLAHILSSNIGFEIVDYKGYQANWFIMGTLGVFALLLCYFLQKLLHRENS